MIVTLTLHPAIDRVLRLHAPLERGGLNRADLLTERPGGKGLNVAAVAHQLGARVLAVTVKAGRNGERLQALLGQAGFPCVCLDAPGATRVNTKLLFDGAHPTEVNETGPALNASALDELLALTPPAKQIVVSGSLPPGITPEMFTVLIRRLMERGPVSVDTSGPALAAALDARPYLIKPNATELHDLGLSAQAVWTRYGVRVLLTRGPDGLEHYGPEGRLELSALLVPVVNPVGAGDATLAGFLVGLERGLGAPGALRLARAAGAAAVMETETGRVSRPMVEQLLAKSAGARQ